MPYASTLLFIWWNFSFRKIKHSQLAGAWNFMNYVDDTEKRGKIGNI
jgi:hypothetical protein